MAEVRLSKLACHAVVLVDPRSQTGLPVVRTVLGTPRNKKVLVHYPYGSVRLRTIAGTYKLFLHVVVVTLAHIIKSVVTGQAPSSLEWKNTRGKKRQHTNSGTRIPGIS